MKHVDKLKQMGKKQNGRPTRYLVEFNSIAESFGMLGATDAQLADALGVSEVTLNAWKKKHPKFLKSLKDGREGADANVGKSLYQRATGYSCPDVHISTHEGKVIKTPIVKHFPPDTTACIFWLKNRRPDLWRDVWKHEHSGPGGGAIQVEHMSAEELRKDMQERGELDERGRFIPANRGN